MAGSGTDVSHSWGWRWAQLGTAVSPRSNRSTSPPTSGSSSDYPGPISPLPASVFPPQCLVLVQRGAAKGHLALVEQQQRKGAELGP